MLIFLYIYLGISLLGLCVMIYSIKNAEEVPQHIDIYDL